MNALWRFQKNEDGTILILFGVSLVVFIGFFAVIFDMGRVSTSQSELQAYADSVALAAAGELDGSADAITRAQAAAADFITDRESFGSGSRTLDSNSYTLLFLNALPTSDTASPAGNVTTDPSEAFFAWVTVNPEVVTMNFLSALRLMSNTGTGTATASVTADAIAGFTVEACDITPLMFCLPNNSYTADANIGALLRLRSGGNGAAWGPGNFGFLDPTNADLGGTCSGLNGSNLYNCLVGGDLNVTRCYTQRGVDTEPGQSVGITDASFNVRFDIYKSTMNGERNNPIYAPAPNVTKGIIPGGGGGNGNGNGNGGGGNQCIGQNEQVSPDTVGLPRDNCYATNSCAYNDRFGDGNWSNGLGNYMSTNHGATVANQTDLENALDFTGVPLGLRTTRYGLYLAEIASAGASGPILSPGLSETGRPQCSSNVAASGAQRRVVIAAGIDCVANPVAGSTRGVPVQEFFEMFMTEPVGDDGNSPPTLDLWVEIIGSAGGDGYGAAGTGGIFRDVVQLYR